MQTALSDRERNLLRTAAVSMSRAVDLYGREYGGAEGVEAAVADVKVKVAAAIARRVERVERQDGERPLEVGLSEAAGVARAPGEDEDEQHAGVPSRAPSAPPERMPSAGAGSASRMDATPPRVSAPALPSRQSPEFAGEHDRPATPRGKPTTEQLVARRRDVLAVLSERRCSTKGLSVELDIALYQANTVLEGLKRAGKVERSEDYANDWPGSTKGRKPSRVWKLVDEPAGCLMADGSPVVVSEVEGGGLDDEESPEPVSVDPTGNGDATTERAGPAICRHAMPAGMCIECGVKGSPEDAPANGARVPVGIMESPTCPHGVVPALCCQRCARDAARRREDEAARADGAPPEWPALGREDYLALLFDAALKDPQAAHVFDRIERLLEIEADG